MRALSFGEILWDIIEGTAHIGGAPFNLAAHLAKMGAESYFISSVGRDRLGDDALEAARAHGVNAGFVRVNRALPTGTVTVAVDEKGHPTFTIHENRAWDDIIVDDAALAEVEGLSWDVFSFGTLAQRTVRNRSTLAAILSSVNATHIYYDVNLRQDFYDKDWIERSLEACTIMKVNEEEQAALSMLLHGRQMTAEEFASWIAPKHNLAVVCITRGEKGCYVYSDDRFEEIGGFPVKVADTVGAGDAFSAGFLFARDQGMDAFASARFACGMGSYVASRPGAVPEYSEEIREEIRKLAGS
jgi:fructokinase